MSSGDEVKTLQAQSFSARHRICRGNIACPFVLVLSIAALGCGSIAYGFGGGKPGNLGDQVKGNEALKTARLLAPLTPTPAPIASPCDTSPKPTTTPASPCGPAPATTPAPPKCGIPLLEKVPELIKQAMNVTTKNGFISCRDFTNTWKAHKELAPTAEPKVQIVGALFKLLAVNFNILESLFALMVIFHGLPNACQKNPDFLLNSETMCSTPAMMSWPEKLTAPTEDNGTACIQYPKAEKTCRAAGRTKMVSPVFKDSKLVKAREKGAGSFLTKWENWMDGTPLLGLKTCRKAVTHAGCDVAFPTCAARNSASFSKCNSACHEAKECVADALIQQFPEVHKKDDKVLCRWALIFVNSCIDKCSTLPPPTTTVEVDEIE